MTHQPPPSTTHEPPSPNEGVVRPGDSPTPEGEPDQGDRVHSPNDGAGRHNSFTGEAARLLEEAVARLETRRTTFTEKEALETLWAAEYEVSPQMDRRFVLAMEAQRRVPRHWRLISHTVANNLLLDALQTDAWDGRNLDDHLVKLDETAGGHHVFCPVDPRFTRRGSRLRAKERDRPVVLDDGVRVSLDALLPELLEHWRAEGSEPRTPVQIEEALTGLGWTSPEREAWLQVRAWLAGRLEVARVGQSHWVPTEALPELGSNARIAVAPVSSGTEPSSPGSAPGGNGPSAAPSGPQGEATTSRGAGEPHNDVTLEPARGIEGVAPPPHGPTATEAGSGAVDGVHTPVVYPPTPDGYGGGKVRDDLEGNRYDSLEPGSEPAPPSPDLVVAEADRLGPLTPARWMMTLRTVHLTHGFLPVPRGARKVYPPRASETERLTALRATWFEDGASFWLWLDRERDCLFGPELLDRLSWLDAGQRLRVEWLPDVIGLKLLDIDQAVQQEETRLADPDTLKKLRAGLGESYRRSIQLILEAAPDGLTFFELVTAVRERQQHEVHRGTIRAVLSAGGFRFVHGRWFSAPEPEKGARALRGAVLDSLGTGSATTEATSEPLPLIARLRERVRVIRERLGDLG